TTATEPRTRTQAATGTRAGWHPFPFRLPLSFSLPRPYACCASAEPGTCRSGAGGGPGTGADTGAVRAEAPAAAGGAAVFIAFERIASDTPVSGTRSDRRREVSLLS